MDLDSMLLFPEDFSGNLMIFRMSRSLKLHCNVQRHTITGISM